MNIEDIVNNALALLRNILADSKGTLSLLSPVEQQKMRALKAQCDSAQDKEVLLHAANEIISMVERNPALRNKVMSIGPESIMPSPKGQPQRESIIATYLAQSNGSDAQNYPTLYHNYMASTLSEVIQALDDLPLSTVQVPKGVFRESPPIEPRLLVLVLIDGASLLAADAPLRSTFWPMLQTFGAAVQTSAAQSRQLELAVIASGMSADERQWSLSAAHDFVPPSAPDSCRHLSGDDVRRSLALLRDVHTAYGDAGISCYHPWLVVLGGGANDDGWSAAAAEIRQAEQSQKLLCFPIALAETDLPGLSRCAGRTPLVVSSTRLDRLFQWLVESFEMVCRTSPGSQLRLPSIDWDVSSTNTQVAQG